MSNYTDFLRPQLTSSVTSLLEVMAHQGVSKAAEGYGGMLGLDVQISSPEVRMVPVLDIPELLGGPENDAVGIYLRAEGDLPGQILLVCPYDRVMELVDLLMGEPAGTTETLGILERSALAELGNLTGTFFLNAVASLTGYAARPSPPAVIVDMVGAILDIVIASLGHKSNQVLMFQTTFSQDGHNVITDFWVLPDQQALDAISRRVEVGRVQ